MTISEKYVSYKFMFYRDFNVYGILLDKLILEQKS